MAKFNTKEELGNHEHDKSLTSDVEDDFFEEEFVPVAKSITDKTKTPVNAVRLAESEEKPKKSRIGDPKKLDTIKEDGEIDTNKKVETSFKCDTCDVYFETSEDAKRHSSSTKCRFACRLCNRKFNTLYAFVVHVMQHKTNAVKNQQSSKSSYLCQSCYKSFDDCFQLKRHEIQFHKKKLTSSLRSVISEHQKLALETEKVPEEGPVITEVQIKPIDGDETSKTVGNALVTCDLCYDIFNSNQELEKHMEFHKQLDNISEQIVIEDDDEFVEVVEDKTDKHDIKTTMRTAKRPSNQTISEHSHNRPNVESEKVTNRLKQTKLSFPISFPNAQLSNKIKEMLTPNSEKVSKTIFLTNPLLSDPLKKKNQRTIAPKISNQESKQITPLSYSVNFTQNPNNTLINPPLQAKQPITLTQHASKPATAVSSSTPSTSSSVTMSTKYAYVIIPHNNSPPVIVPTESIPLNLTGQKDNNPSCMLNNKNIDTNPSGTVSVQSSTNSCVSNISNIQMSTYLNQTIEGALNTLASVNSIGTNNSSLVNKSSNDSNVKSLLQNSHSSSVEPKYTNCVGSISIAQKSTDLPEIVIIDSDDEEPNDPTPSNKTERLDLYPVQENNISIDDHIVSHNSTEHKPHTPQTTEGNTQPEMTIGDQITTNNEIVQPDSKNVDETQRNGDKKKTDDSSDSETADLVIDEKEDETNKYVNTVDFKDTTFDNAVPKEKDDQELDNNKEEESTLQGMITVKKLEDLIELRVEPDSKIKEKKRKKYNFPMKCPDCPVLFNRVRGMRLHEKKKRKCIHCEYRICRVLALRNHYLEEHGLYSCLQCGFFTNIKTELDEHRKNHVSRKYKLKEKKVKVKPKIEKKEPNCETSEAGLETISKDSEYKDESTIIL